MHTEDQKCELKLLLEEAAIRQIDTKLKPFLLPTNDQVSTLSILHQFNDQSTRLKPYTFKKLVKVASSLDLEGDPNSYLNPRGISRIPWSNQNKIEKYCRKAVPFIIENCPLVKHSIDTWTMKNLEEKFGDTGCTVFESDSKYFRYWKCEKDKTLYDTPFEQPYISSDITFKNFLSEAKKRLDILSAKAENNGNMQTKKMPKWMYAQISLSGLPQFGTEFSKWDWTWILHKTKKFGWGLPDTNLLLIGMKGVKTPVHFDEQENLFCQVHGQKRVCLYPPADYERMYPYPYGHPCDRQSMVNIANPNLECFPNFRKTRCITSILGPGDTLHIPAYWWHYFENLDNFATSITFWSKQRSPKEAPSFPLSCTQLVAARRNLETIMLKHFSHMTDGTKKIRHVLKVVQDKNSKVRKELENLVQLLLPKRTHLIQGLINNLVIGRYDRPIEWYNKPSLVDSEKTVST